ncbi:hypothetical protein CONCODRAFT_5671 [Conidiobolus coronatus NRRL 28638]|uniref:F-box domain-containing protein n=1 Tax=Conidiobolus coronatus (strain ATCC 28846 / CBS 209.66 / NRRL 28638) TaxID=796925 RepID=A0A137P9A8_CONC2|nr:hypothetical protein CONCODRAFT_5671 [Conidiobolus coronatus NRRL 28638]|eukprot:KXN71596.1 hypothetical protein CONCODRAFT_5671 [Conidiobolus coronatus NRRL 28638]
MVNDNYLINWELVLKLDEIHEFLRYEDLKNLSFCSKEVYFKARPLLLSQVYLSSDLFADNLTVSDGNSVDTSDNDNETDLSKKVLESTKSIINYVTSVNIKYSNKLLKNPIDYISKINNLASLTFYHRKTTLKLDELNLVLSTLKHLRVLKLINISINSKSGETDSSLYFPNSLVKLVISQCYWPQHNKLLRENAASLPDLGPYSQLSSIKLVNLKWFEYYSIDQHLNYNPLPTILLNSPKLNTLSADAFYLTQSCFELISKSKSLRSIEIKDLSGDIFSPDYTNNDQIYSTIDTLKYTFVYKLTQSQSNLEKFLLKFPNLTRLTLPFTQKLVQALKHTLHQLINLKTLTIQNLSTEKGALNLNFNNYSVEGLTFEGFKVSQVKLKDLESWKGLKWVEFKCKTANEIDIVSEYNNVIKSDLSKLDFGESWRLIEYLECIRLYKV